MAYIKVSSKRAGHPMPVYLNTDTIVTVLPSDEKKFSEGLITTIRFTSSEVGYCAESCEEVMLMIKAVEVGGDDPLIRREATRIQCEQVGKLIMRDMCELEQADIKNSTTLLVDYDQVWNLVHGNLQRYFNVENDDDSEAT